MNQTTSSSSQQTTDFKRMQRHANAVAKAMNSKKTMTKNAWTFSSANKHTGSEYSRMRDLAPPSTKYTPNFDSTRPVNKAFTIPQRRKSVQDTSTLPCPGQYDLPELKKPRFYMSPVPRDTTASMATKRGMKTPEYAVEDPFSIGKKCKGGRMSNISRFPAPKANTPGPGEYMTDTMPISRATGANFGKGPGRTHIGPRATLTPGPGEYPPMTAFDKAKAADISFNGSVMVAHRLRDIGDGAGLDLASDPKLANDMKLLNATRQEVSRFSALRAFDAV